MYTTYKQQNNNGKEKMSHLSIFDGIYRVNNTTEYNKLIKRILNRINIKIQKYNELGSTEAENEINTNGVYEDLLPNLFSRYKNPNKRWALELPKATKKNMNLFFEGLTFNHDIQRIDIDYSNYHSRYPRFTFIKIFLEELDAVNFRKRGVIDGGYLHEIDEEGRTWTIHRTERFAKKWL